MAPCTIPLRTYWQPSERGPKAPPLLGSCTASQDLSSAFAIEGESVGAGVVAGDSGAAAQKFAPCRRYLASQSHWPTALGASEADTQRELAPYMPWQNTSSVHVERNMS